MLDTEEQWSEALASNNIRAIIRWLRQLTTDGEADMEEILLTFSHWVQRKSEFAKKELLTLCFSRCQGLWIFLNRSSFTRVHMLLQRLRNLLTLAQWARRKLNSTHLWHGTGVPCVVCRDTLGSTDIRQGCWDREHRVLQQHIWLGRLVQWWGIMGLLPKYPEAHEVKCISQMWKEMRHSHRKACLETHKCSRLSSLIQGMVIQLDRQHGCIWTAGECTERSYPPPNLQALLKLVLVPHIDNMSVQALLMYFVLDMANFLQCKDDLLQSFSCAFTIPSSFSQQIRAFWLLDHGHVKASMELLLSPRAAVPWFPWQHHCIIHCLLMRKQPQLALRYLHWTRPAIGSIEDAKLCADVLLQNRCVSEAWALLKRGHTESYDMVLHFLKACCRVGLCAEALKYIPAGYNAEGELVNGIGSRGSELLQVKKAKSSPHPLSATLYQTQRVNTEELVQLVRKAAMEVKNPHAKISEVVWPEQTERKSGKLNSKEIFLSTLALRRLTPSPSAMHMIEETEPAAHADEEEEQPPEHIPSSVDLSSGSVSPFTSASSLPLLRRDRPYVYESTLTLQRISSLLTDEGSQDREEEDHSPSSTTGLPDCPEQTVTLDGASNPIFLNNLNKEALVELVLSVAEGEDNVKKDVLSSKNLVNIDAVSGAYTDENLPVHKSSDDNQSVSNRPKLKVESQTCLSLDDEKIACCKEAPEEIATDSSPDVTARWSSALLLNHDDHSDHISYEIFSLGKAACFLEEFHQKSHPEDVVRFSCALSDTPQDVLCHPDPVASSPGASAALLPTLCSSPTRLQQISSNSPILSQSSVAARESSPEAKLKTDEPYVQSAPAWLDRCKMGSWMKQDLETCTASGRILCASEPRAAITQDHKRPSLALSQPYSYSLVDFMEFTAKQRGENRAGTQADKEESAGWSSLRRASQGAIRNERGRSRKGKRVKKA